MLASLKDTVRYTTEVALQHHWLRKENTTFLRYEGTNNILFSCFKVSGTQEMSLTRDVQEIAVLSRERQHFFLEELLVKNETGFLQSMTISGPMRADQNTFCRMQGRLYRKGRATFGLYQGAFAARVHTHFVFERRRLGL